MLMTATIRCPRGREDLALHEVGREGLLYDREGELVHILNVTALAIWRLCDGNQDVDRIEGALRAKFSDLDGHDVRGDIERILNQFGERGLLAGEGSTMTPPPAGLKQRSDDGSQRRI